MKKLVQLKNKENENLDPINLNYEERLQKLEGTILYSNESGTTADIALSDNISNYSFIEVEYERNNAVKTTGKIKNYNSMRLETYLAYWDELSSQTIWQSSMEIINANNNKITRNDTYYSNFSNNSYIGSGNFTGGFNILRVIGYK